MPYSIKQKCAFLEVLDKSSEPMRPADIGELMQMSAYDAGHLAPQLKSSHLIGWANKAKHLYRITERGKGYLANPPAEIEADRSMPAALDGGKSDGKSDETQPLQHPGLGSEVVHTPAQSPGPEGRDMSEEKESVDIPIPSQADTFSSIGESLGFEKSVSDKRELSLRTVVSYVRKLADMDSLDEIEKAMIELNVSKDIIKRWLRLYAQSLPAKGVAISPELKERLGFQEEGGKTAREQRREPRLYNVLDGRMFPDPEGELTFGQALQQVAVERGASASQGAELAAALAKAPSELVSILLPILTKAPPTPDNTMIQNLQQQIQQQQQRLEQLADDKHKAEMDSIRAEIRAGQRPAEADEQVKTLSGQIAELRELLHSQELERLQEQSQAQVGALLAKLEKLEVQIATVASGKQADSKISLMSEALKAGKEELSGIRQDVKTLVPELLHKGPSRPRSSSEKKGFNTGLDKGIEKARASTALEDELFFEGPPKS